MPRRTHCFTYGESRTQSLTMNGAHVTLAQYKTACGEWSEDPDAAAGPPDSRARRPKGTCPKCFKAWRQACREFARLPSHSPDASF